MVNFRRSGGVMQQDHSNYYVATLRAGLQSRALVTPLPAAFRPWQCVFLQSGSLRVTAADGAPENIHAPAVICWPHDRPLALHLLAGSTGVHLALEDRFLDSVLGKRPEASALRDATQGFATLLLEEKPQIRARVTAALGEILLEQEAESTGQLLVIEAQLRCLLVHLWRHAEYAGDRPQTKGQQTAILHKFRQLVEARFHDRWRVADYAAALHITPDRLHNIATRALGKTPLTLIHERSHREARALLTRTDMSLDQIAAHLNFKTTQQFSAFFQKHEGRPPGKYRARVVKDASPRGTAEMAGFSDWP